MLKVLVADLDADILRLLRAKLGAASYEVFTARDATEAIALTSQHHPDAVIMAWYFPDVSGVQLINQIRGASHKPPIVIMLSGKMNDADIATAFASGVTDFVGKPFSPQGLLERLHVNLIRAGMAVNSPVEN